MPLYFIEMGQGIIAGGDLRVCTSTLYSCTLIAGFNEHTGRGGAYHFPSNSLDDPDVRADMDAWALELDPTDVTLVLAKDATGAGQMGASEDDQQQLEFWALEVCGVSPEMTFANGAGVALTAGGIQAGRPTELDGDFSLGKAVHLEARLAGSYLEPAPYTLVGQNREKTKK